MPLISPMCDRHCRTAEQERGTQSPLRADLVLMREVRCAIGSQACITLLQAARWAPHTSRAWLQFLLQRCSGDSKNRRDQRPILDLVRIGVVDGVLSRLLLQPENSMLLNLAQDAVPQTRPRIPASAPPLLDTCPHLPRSSRAPWKPNQDSQDRTDTLSLPAEQASHLSHPGSPLTKRATQMGFQTPGTLTL